jgi:hypothetical protein
MAFQFLRELANTNRKTRYLTNIRSEDYTKEKLSKSNKDLEDVIVRDTVTSQSKEEVDKIIDRVEEEDNIIIETATHHYNQLSDKSKYLRQMRNIIQKTDELNGLTYLYFSAEGIDDLKRREIEVINMCDALFDIDNVSSEGNIQTKMLIRKLNKREDIDDDDVLEPLRLRFGENIRLDTSRKIR